MKSIVLIFVFLFSTLVFADRIAENRGNAGVPQEVLDMSASERVREYCLDLDWTKASCPQLSIEKLNKPGSEGIYEQYHANGFRRQAARQVGSMVWAGIYAIPEVLRGAYEMLPDSVRKMGGDACEESDGTIQLRTIKNEIVELADQQNLNQCQRGCLALCASNLSVLRHANGAALKARSLAGIIENKIGTCTEFSRMTDYYAEELGLESYVLTNNVHSYAQITVDGKPVYVDSQATRFYEEGVRNNLANSCFHLTD